MDDEAGDKEGDNNPNNQTSNKHIQIARIDPKTYSDEHRNACNLEDSPLHGVCPKPLITQFVVQIRRKAISQKKGRGISIKIIV